MVYSMTGYGKAEVAVGIVAVKNHKSGLPCAGKCKKGHCLLSRDKYLALL